MQTEHRPVKITCLTYIDSDRNLEAVNSKACSIHLFRLTLAYTNELTLLGIQFRCSTPNRLGGGEYIYSLPL